MRTRVIIKFLGFVLLFNALFLYTSAAISWANNESSLAPLLFSAIFCTFLGAFPFIFVEPIEEISLLEGIAISVSGWIMTCFVGAIPYFMWGGEFTFANALFESVSGFTTTGSTILNNIEGLTKGLLFWRSSTHFIGGIGIILFVLLILPDAKGIRSSIYRSEVSGLSLMNFKTRAKRIVKIITIVYISLTVVLTGLLWIQGMTFFDAVCHSFGTIATGGFSTKNASISYYNNVGIEVTLTVFMYLSSLHFGVLFLTITGNRVNIFTHKVIRAYTFVLLGGIVLITANLMLQQGYTFANGLRHASFQVVTVASTTGSATIDTDVWPLFSKIILIYFTIQCAMVGSTGGGIKFDRIYLFTASLKRRLKILRHPQSIHITRMNGNIIDQDLELLTMTFIILYIIVFFVVTLVLAAMNIDGMTAFTASITTIGNVGPGFGRISSLGNFGTLPDAAKYILSANMLLGRLEIFNVLTFFLILFKKRG